MRTGWMVQDYTTERAGSQRDSKKITALMFARHSETILYKFGKQKIS